MMTDSRSRILGVVVSLVMCLALGSTAAVTQDPDASFADGSVRILRDEYGVPHVYGSTLESVWFGVGYAQGQDRLWQAEVLRRTATGTSAELFGSSALAGDTFARTLFGSAARRAALFASAPPETRTIFRALAAGLNAWITDATETGRLPPEYAAFGISPRPWTVDDSIAQAMLVLRNLGEFGSDEVTNAAALQELIARFGPAEAQKIFLDTHWLNDPSAVTSVPTEGAITAVPRSAAPSVRPLSPGAAEAIAQLRATQANWDKHLNRAGLARGPKSNGAVIGPKLSADGHALLLGGPQMGYSAPQINHEMGIHGAGFDVTGMNIAGLPGIPVGVGREHAWTLTSGFTKNNYIYVEQVNAQGQYLFNGELRNLDCRVETIGVRGVGNVQQAVCESVHGPIVGSGPGVAFALKSAVRGFELQGVAAFHDMMRARSIGEFETALSRAVYNFNVLYADAGGNIAYWHVGRIPVPAANDNIWLPRDGSGSAEWQGFVPFEAMPRSLNPERGWLASWNNKPAAHWNSTVSGFGTWGPVHRGNTLVTLLNQVTPGTATIATLEHINRTAGHTTDTPSSASFNMFAPTVVAHMLDQVNLGADDRLPQIVTLLDQWDWQQTDVDADGFYDSPAVAVFNTWWQIMTDTTFRDDLGSTFQPNVVANMVHRVIVPDPAVPLLHDYLDGQSADDVMTATLITALDTLQARYGSANPSDWHQPIAHIVWTPLGIGKVPNTIWMNRGTYNQIVHLGKGPQMYGQNVVAPGQSGDPGSVHFADQLPLYANWLYKPMRLNRQDLQGVIQSSITLHSAR
jgi:penicillin amidase